MEKIKVAIVGTGNIAQKVHIPQFSQSPVCEVVAVCSRDKSKAESVARLFAIPQSFSSIEETLAIAKPGIVVVCAPNAFHFEITMKSLQSGCHVFCEKPPAISFRQAKEMADMSKEMNKVLAYNFNMRQKQEALILKQKINEGCFGTIYHLNATFVRRRGIPGWGNFTNKALQGGGALIDIGVHVLDLALHFLDYPPCHSVMANVYDFIGKQGGFGLLGGWDKEHFSVEDSCFAHLKLGNKVSITLQTAFALNTQSQSTINIEVFGSKAGATLFPLAFFSEEENRLVDTAYTYRDENNSQALSMQQFLEMCAGGNTNICTADEGAMLQGVVGMIYDNAVVE
jgi:predicted dehydrogenase